MRPGASFLVLWSMNTDERGQAVSDADEPGGADDMPRAAEQQTSGASIGRVAGDPAGAKTMDARRNGAPIERVTAYKLAIALGALAWADAAAMLTMIRNERAVKGWNSPRRKSTWRVSRVPRRILPRSKLPPSRKRRRVPRSSV